MADRVTIVVPDATRSIDYRSALDGLAAPGATVIVGLGLHRRMNTEELAPLQAACGEFGHELVQHDPERTVRVGDGRFAPEVVRADDLVCVGVVEPHQYAGFSGGIKGAVIGCGSKDLIAEMHSLPMLRRCKAQVGWFEGNPFQEKLWELAGGLTPRRRGWFLVPGAEDVFDGELRASFERAVATSRKLHFREVEQPVDSMLLRVSSPKDVNFYQASRAATYVALASSPAIREGGTLYLEASCPEGIGEGTGERACAEALQKGRARLLAELYAQQPPGTRGGQQRAYVLAMALQRVRIVLCGASDIPELRAIGIDQRNGPPDQVNLVQADPFHDVPVAREHP